MDVDEPLDEHLTSIVQTVLSRTDRSRLEVHARRQGHTKSSLLRLVIRDWMQRQESRAPSE